MVYITSIMNDAPSSSASPAPPPKAFFQNKPLEGGVFALVGIVVLVVIIMIITCALRRRSRSRLENEINEAVSFDPAGVNHYVDVERRMNSMEKYRWSGSSSGHGHGFGYGPGIDYQAQPAQQQGYYGQYTHQPGAVRVPSPYRTPSPIEQQRVAATDQDAGANLTRKFSDRKPVPPLLPNPVYDPSRAVVTSSPATSDPYGMDTYGMDAYGVGHHVPANVHANLVPAAPATTVPALPDTFGEASPPVLHVANR